MDAEILSPASRDSVLFSYIVVTSCPSLCCATSRGVYLIMGYARLLLLLLGGGGVR